MRLSLIAVLISLFTSLPVFAAWQLENQQSTLTFISIKKGNVAEVHQFNQLVGSISEQGNITFTIDLSSVDTAIAIRDERMKEFLFQTNLYPSAVFNATIPQDFLTTMAVGQSEVITINGDLSLHGQKQNVAAKLMVSKLSDKKIIVSAMKPIIVLAKQYDLVAGISKLQELAGLPSISDAVPVSFVLSFNHVAN